MAIQRVGVIGAGTMGNGIAHVFARSGYDVELCDLEQKFLDRALAVIAKNLDREVAKAKITEAQKTETLKRIRSTTDRSQLAACDFIVEAASEKLEIKSELISRVGSLLPAGSDTGFEYVFHFHHQTGRRQRRVRSKSSGCISSIPCR